MDEPSSPQSGNITFQALADELGRTTPAMYDLCNAQQVFAHGTDTPISPSNADRLRDAHEDMMRRRKILQDSEQSAGARRWSTKAEEYAEAAYHQWPGTPGAHEIARQWAEQLFDVDEAVEWWSAGMRGEDAALAGILREYGVQPHHLAIAVRKDTILFRLINQKMAPETIVRILRQEGHLGTDADLHPANPTAIHKIKRA